MKIHPEKKIHSSSTMIPPDARGPRSFDSTFQLLFWRDFEGSFSEGGGGLTFNTWFSRRWCAQM
jgi:hypothetical protein